MKAKSVRNTTPPPMPHADMAAAATALREMLQWTVEPVLRPKARIYDDVAIARRAVVLAWSIDPAMVGGRSLRGLARHLGINKRTMFRWADQARKRFGIRNYYHAHDWRHY